MVVLAGRRTWRVLLAPLIQGCTSQTAEGGVAPGVPGPRTPAPRPCDGAPADADGPAPPWRSGCRPALGLVHLGPAHDGDLGPADGAGPLGGRAPVLQRHRLRILEFALL